MSSLKVLICIAFGLLVLACTTEAVCGVCSTTSFAACLNETSFHPCTDGATPSKEIETCRENTVCTDTQGVCQPNVIGVVPDCTISGKCNDCSGTAPFACVSQTQFAFCTADKKLGHVGTCEQGKFCSISQLSSTGQICHLSCVAEPTCQNTEPEAPPEENWKESCNTVTTTGYFLNVHDTSCKTYVYCEKVNNVMNAVKYTCLSGYFDAASERCIDKKPSTCY